MHFDLTDLRLFVHVCEAKSLTGGARQAHLSTPAASMRIKALEHQLGTRLLYRSSQGVDLTPAGHRLLTQARLVLRQVEHLKTEFTEHASDASGHLRIFANTTAVTEFLPEVLARFLAERPGVTVDLQERLNRDILRGVLDGTSDLGVIAGSVETPGLEVLPFSRDHLVVAIPLSHPLAERKRVRLTETLAYPHVGLHDGSTLLSFLRDRLEALGEPLTLRTQVYGFEAVCRMIEVGVGIGIVPVSAVRRHQRTMRLRWVALDEPWALRERSVITRELAALPGCARALVEALVAYGDAEREPEMVAQ